MRIAISHMDAFRCYRSGRIDYSPSIQKIELAQDFVPQLKWQEALFLQSHFETAIPVQTDVPTKANRRKSNYLECHILPKGIPAKSYIHLGKQTYLASPELCAFELRNCLDEASLAFAISELCSDFSIANLAETEYRNRPPLTRIEALDSFTADCMRTRNSLVFKRALGHSFDNAHSPMELALALLLSLPAELGGYELPKPQLNSAVCGYEGERPDSFVQDNRATKGVRYGDLVFREQSVVVEYISKKHHQDRWDADALRGNELLDAGFKTVFVSPEQVLNASSTHSLAKKLSHQLLATTPSPSEDWLLANKLLRERLFKIANLH